MSHDYYITPEDYEKALENGVSSKLLQLRVYHRLWKKERAIKTPPRKMKINCKYVKQAKENGICYSTYKKRLRLGWSKEDASTKPIVNTHNKKYMDKMREKSIKKTRKYPDYVYKNLQKHNISPQTFYNRINLYKWSIEEACTTPPLKQGKKRHKIISHAWMIDNEIKGK